MDSLVAAGVVSGGHLIPVIRRPAFDVGLCRPALQAAPLDCWAAVKTYLDAVADHATAPVIAKYTGVLAAADVFTASNAFVISSRSAWTSASARRSTPDAMT